MKMKHDAQLFRALAWICMCLALFSLLGMLLVLLLDAWPRLGLGFISGYPSRFPLKAGVAPAIVGSLYLGTLTALISFPLGLATAIYLEEYLSRGWFSRIIELNIANLAGVPSIIFGLLGLQVFARYLGLGKSLLAGALTLSLLVLPIVIITSREALRAIPRDIRAASLALGASRWQTIIYQVVPAALPGILTGLIFAVSRAIGETAPLITLGALTYVAFVPKDLLSPFTALPIQAFNWLSRPQAAFHHNAAAAIVILLLLLLCLNGAAVYLRQRFKR